MSGYNVFRFGLVFGLLAAPAAALAQTREPVDRPTKLDCQTPRFVDFAVGSWRLSPRATAALDQVAQWARNDTARSVRLRGLTDPTGGAKINATLSDKRADTVKAYLTQQGLDPMRITAIGHGENVVRDSSNQRRAVEIVQCTAAPAVAVVPVAEPPAQPAPAAEPQPAPEPAREPAPPATVPPPIAPVAAAQPDPERGRPPGDGLGLGATVGGGVTGFVDEEVRDFTETGGSWNARLTLGTRSRLAFEAAYVGSAQGIAALGLESDALLVGQGGEAAARLNLTRAAVQPYLFGGIGWTRYRLARTPTNTSSISTRDDILSVPFGAGIGFRIARNLMLDVRGTGRAAFYDDMMDAPFAATGQNARLHHWDVGGLLGWEF